MQQVWQHQRLLRDRLHTLDGQSLVVLHPGFHNREPGPDFRQALLQFGQEEPLSGDIEVDRHPMGWRQHGHHDNPDYAQVVLHVLWGPTARREAPCRALALLPHLDSPLPQLERWAKSQTAPALLADLRGQCAAPLQALRAPARQQLLHRIALDRFQGRAAWIQSRARVTGWEQALWERVFRCLGYKGNAWPMQRLAELLPHLREAGLGQEAILARLLGVAGLLPSHLPSTPHGSRARLRRLWDHWWRVREPVREFILPPHAWQWHGVRPANHPVRRLVWASHWLAQQNLAGALQTWLLRPSRCPATALGRLLEPRPDPFWSCHVSFQSPPLRRPAALLGRARTTDLAVNAILPWLWVRAAAGGASKFQARIESMFLEWPAAQDNALLRRARERLIGTEDADPAVDGAAAQQGLLEILDSFCATSDACCQGCEFPRQLDHWADS